MSESRCTCRVAEVTGGDLVDLRNGVVQVHGLHHCYIYTSRYAKSGQVTVAMGMKP